MKGDKGFEVVGPGLGRELFGGRRFDDRAGLFQMSQRGPAQLQQQCHVSGDRVKPRSADDGAAAPATLDLDELLGLENPQRLPQRLPGDLQLRGELGLRRQLLVGRELPGEDLTP